MKTTDQSLLYEVMKNLQLYTNNSVPHKHLTKGEYSWNASLDQLKKRSGQ